MAWSRIINQTFAACTKTDTLFFQWLSDSQSSPCTVIIRRWLEADLTSSAIRNWITTRCSSVVEFCIMNTILFSYRVNWTSLFFRASDLSCACWRPCILRVHNEDSDRILRRLATSPLSRAGKYANGYVATTFRIFSFEYPLYILTQFLNDCWKNVKAFTHMVLNIENLSKLRKKIDFGWYTFMS